MSKLRELVKEMIRQIKEENAGSSGGEYSTPFAFSKTTNNKATNSAKKLGMKPINEVSYRSFNKTVSEVSPERKISKAIGGIKKRLKEINQIVDYSIRLREEHNLTNENYLSNSVKSLNEISLSLMELNKKIKNLKS